MKLLSAMIRGTAVFGMLLCTPVVLLASGGEDLANAYGLTNSNTDQSAFFWVRTKDGKTSVIEVPPGGEKKLPLNTDDFQFLFMEKRAPVVLSPKELSPTSSVSDPDSNYQDTNLGHEPQPGQKISRLRKFYRDYL